MAYNTGGRIMSGREARAGDGARPGRQACRLRHGCEIRHQAGRHALCPHSLHVPSDHRLRSRLGRAAPLAMSSISRRAAADPKQPPGDLPREPAPDELPPETPPAELPPERDPPPDAIPQEFPPSPSPGEMPPGDSPPTEIPQTTRSRGSHISERSRLLAAGDRSALTPRRPSRAHRIREGTPKGYGSEPSSLFVIPRFRGNDGRRM